MIMNILAYKTPFVLRVHMRGRCTQNMHECLIKEKVAHM